MSRAQSLALPKLDCPNCGVGLISPHGRGRYDSDGNYAEHRDGCRCPWCDWMWFDDAEPVECLCGARVRVVVDNGRAYARLDADRKENAR